MLTGVTTIVVAGGGGERFGGPKQFATLRGASVLDRAVTTARRCSQRVVVVLPAGVAWSAPEGVAIVLGGATRSASTRAGLEAVSADAEIVVVHDAARPLASPALYERVVTAVRGGADAAVPGLPVSDTLKQVDADVVVGTIPRDGLVAVQTPQAFTAAALRQAHASAPDATDDAAVIEADGGRVVVVPGDPRNVKITVAADLEIAAALLEVP
ncbi:MAG TPA: IspD/TarI family cytidylyltransferase [Acidimicrobiia bacterium]